ncbi:MAG TPA: L-histidine N(alpha)-methyltransferase [Vicinamibacterales bacterium]|jgi:dimethylhistidine N-methyltransferase
MRPSVASGTARADRSPFAEDVEYYLSLTPRQLPSQYLYDDLGSALFEAICALPWYRITRAEQQLLAAHAADIVADASPLSTFIELGPGSGVKLATLLSATGDDPQATVHLVDVSAAALDNATRSLDAFPGAHVVAHQAEYEAGLGELAHTRRRPGCALALFLGSNIGNFDPPGAASFLRSIRSSLAPGDRFLMGADLVKPARDLLLAYDDPLGVTAAFNRNLLVRANRELGANFDLDGFCHRAIWNEQASRVEMHLVSRRAQRVQIPDARLDVSFASGETIWTESSYKYRTGEILEMLGQAGFSPSAQWVDERSAFALTLVRAT